MSKTSLKYFLFSIYFHVTPIIGTPLFRDYDATMQQDAADRAEAESTRQLAENRSQLRETLITKLLSAT